jgi:uncharacterized membrane protein (DUF373 family)
MGKWADQSFIKVESVSYFVLGVLLTLAVVKGLADAGSELLDSVQVHGDIGALIFAIDRMLLVLMIVEILHTVGVSFRSHSLTAEPFLVVGLIASIRRMLVITLESSQVRQASRLAPDGRVLLNAALLELIVMGFLILVMVISIVLLRRSKSSAICKM